MVLENVPEFIENPRFRDVAWGLGKDGDRSDSDIHTNLKPIMHPARVQTSRVGFRGQCVSLCVG